MNSSLRINVFLLLLIAVFPMRAALIVYDGFNYTAAAPVTGNGGTGWSGSWSGNNTVTSPGYSYSTLPVEGNRVTTSGDNFGSFRSLSSQSGSGTYYVSFIVQRVTGDGSGYGGISLYAGGAEQLFIGQTSDQNNFGLQRHGTGGSTVNSTAPSTTLSFLVVRIDFNGANSSARLYVNPTLGTEPGSANATIATMAAFNFDQVRIQSGNGTGPTFGFDEVRIGTTYADVAPVPEPVNVALLAFAGFAVLYGGFRQLRKQSK